MYEAVRTRAPISTKVTGVSAMVLGLLAAGYAFANGLGAGIIEAIRPPTIMTMIADEKPPPQDRPETEVLSTTVAAPEPPPPTLPDQDFSTDRKSPIEVDAEKRPPDEPRVNVVPAPRSPVRGLPKLSAKDKPAYPPPAIRGHKEGTTGIDVCVDAKGRVTQVSLASSSGHEILDDAAMKWVRGTRFAPGTLDGAAAAMCGARVFYEWKIED
jgi:protein TonB